MFLCLLLTLVKRAPYCVSLTCIEPSPRLKNVFSRVKLGLVHVLVTEP